MHGSIISANPDIVDRPKVRRETENLGKELQEHENFPVKHYTTKTPGSLTGSVTLTHNNIPASSVVRQYLRTPPYLRRECCVNFHIHNDAGQMTSKNEILKRGSNNTCECVSNELSEILTLLILAEKLENS